MKDLEAKQRKATEVFSHKYRQWLESQDGQTDGYEYEASFLRFMEEIGQEAFQTSMEGEKAPSKKKLPPR